VVAWRFRISWLRHPIGQYSILFILYNLMLIGVLAYTTGGGLKRAPFVALIYLLLAFSFAPTSPQDKPLFSALSGAVGAVAGRLSAVVAGRKSRRQL